MDDKDEDEEEQMVDMEIAVIDQTNNCSLIFSDSPTFSKVSNLVNDIFKPTIAKNVKKLRLKRMKKYRYLKKKKRLIRVTWRKR